MAVYLAERDVLSRMVVARIGSAAEAEDVIQDLWVRLREQALVDVQHARSYLFQMTRNLVTDRLRARQRLMTRERRWSDEATGFVATADEQVDPAKSQEQILLEREDVATIASAISNLPPGARRAFELHKLDGLSQPEVARLLGISRSGVEKHMAVAMQHLKRALEN